MAISVEKDGDEFIGTGFICCYKINDVKRHFLITAKHNIDPDDNIKLLAIRDAADSAFPHDNLTWTIHPEIDLAYAYLEQFNGPYFSLSPLCLVLTETITLGFPRVPTTDRSYMLAHRGEINALVSSYLRKGSYLLISNAISPGSSGSPIVDRSGVVLGVVTDSFESGFDPDTFPTIARAALACEEIIRFLYKTWVEP